MAESTQTTLRSVKMCNAATHWVGRTLSQLNLLLCGDGGGRYGVAWGCICGRASFHITCTLEIRRQGASEAAEAEKIMTVDPAPEELDLGTRGG